jgi:hypothetical protein
MNIAIRTQRALIATWRSGAGRRGYILVRANKGAGKRLPSMRRHESALQLSAPCAACGFGNPSSGACHPVGSKWLRAFPTELDAHAEAPEGREHALQRSPPRLVGPLIRRRELPDIPCLYTYHNLMHGQR